MVRKKQPQVTQSLEKKSKDPPGKTFKSTKKEIMKQCGTTLYNFYSVSYKYFEKLVTSTKFKCDVILDLKMQKKKKYFLCTIIIYKSEIVKK